MLDLESDTRRRGGGLGAGGGGGGGGAGAQNRPPPRPLPTLTPFQKSRIAFQRFGLGAKPGGPARVGFGRDSALYACLAELANPAAALITDATLPTYAQACVAGTTDFTTSNNVTTVELRARYAKHMEPEIGFVERLVLFWSNHFSMNKGKGDMLRSTIGHFERDVIRKNVLGKFEDLLIGVLTHPAMIVYLDNQRSFGAYSQIGRTGVYGYNENLAREVMELHTLGVNGPYRQADVTNFAKVLTGWSQVSAWDAANNYYGGNSGNVGQFIYRDAGHEPGAFTIMGKEYAQLGQQQGLAVLRALARHPSTAQTISFQLLLHFVTDAPTPAMVAKLAAVFIQTAGDLKAVARAMLLMPEAWAAPMNRIRTPYLSLVGQLRAIGGPAVNSGNEYNINQALTFQNHAPWSCLTPDGYPDENYNWMNPDAMRVREDSAYMLAGMFQPSYAGPAAPDLAAGLFPGSLSADSLQAIQLWGTDVRRGLSTLFMTPEFLRR